MMGKLGGGSFPIDIFFLWNCIILSSSKRDQSLVQEVGPCIVHWTPHVYGVILYLRFENTEAFKINDTNMQIMLLNNKCFNVNNSLKRVIVTAVTQNGTKWRGAILTSCYSAEWVVCENVKGVLCIFSWMCECFYLIFTKALCYKSCWYLQKEMILKISKIQKLSCILFFLCAVIIVQIWQILLVTFIW